MAPLSHYQIVQSCTEVLAEQLDVPLLVKNGVSTDFLTARQGQKLMAVIDEKNGQLKAVLLLLSFMEEKQNCLDELLKVLRRSVDFTTGSYTRQSGHHSHYKVISSLEGKRMEPHEGIAESGRGSEHSSHRSSLQSMSESLDDSSHFDTASLHSTHSEMVTGVGKNMADLPPRLSCTLPDTRKTSTAFSKKRHSTGEQSLGSSAPTMSNSAGSLSLFAFSNEGIGDHDTMAEMDRICKNNTHLKEENDQLKRKLQEMEKLVAASQESGKVKQLESSGKLQPASKKDKKKQPASKEDTKELSASKEDEKPLELSDILLPHELQAMRSQDKSSSLHNFLSLPSIPKKNRLERRYSDTLLSRCYGDKV